MLALRKQMMLRCVGVEILKEVEEALMQNVNLECQSSKIRLIRKLKMNEQKHLFVDVTMEKYFMSSTCQKRKKLTFEKKNVCLLSIKNLYLYTFTPFWLSSLAHLLKKKQLVVSFMLLSK